MRPSRAAPRLALAVLLAMAAMACGLVDVFQSSGVEAVTLVYQGDAFVPLDSTVAFTVVVEVGGATLSRPHLSITSSDTSIVALTPGRDSLIGRKTGNATLTIRLESSMLTDPADRERRVAGLPTDQRIASGSQSDDGRVG